MNLKKSTFEHDKTQFQILLIGTSEPIQKRSKLVLSMKQKRFFLHALILLFALAITDAQAQVKIYPDIATSSSLFWKIYKKGTEYQHTNIHKADSMRFVLLDLAKNENDSIQFYAYLFDAEIDKIHGAKDVYFDKIQWLAANSTQMQFSKIQYEIDFRMAEYHQYKLDYKNSNQILRRLLQEMRKTRENKEISKIYMLLALTKMNQNDKDSSMYFVDESIQFARRSAQKTAMAAAFHLQATVYNYFGQIELSVSKNLIALQLATEANFIPKIIQFSLDLGVSQMSILNYNEARLYFQQALDNANRIKDNRLKSIAQLNLGTIYLKEKNYKKAITFQNNALETLMSLKDFDGLGMVYNNLGDIYRETQDYAKALSNYNKSLVYFESSGNQAEIATVYHNVGIVFYKQGKHQNALNYLNRSATIRSKFGFKGVIYETYRAISDVYEKTGNYKLAHNYLQMYADYSDSAKTIESSAKIAELNELYRTEQREQFISSQSDSIQRQKQDKQLTSFQLENIQLKNNMQAYIIFGFVLVVILGGIIVFYRWNQTTIRQLQQQSEMNQTLLRAQMNPHFVFNAMSVIQSYIYDNDIKNSSKFLVNFSKLMRLILENSSKEFILLETEIEILDKYLSIQKLRFGERFDYEIDADNIMSKSDVVIPPMITQPFVENAIEHGQLHLRTDGYIKVRFYSDNKMLFIEVTDNGIGRKNSEKNNKGREHKSMAMKITKERIDNLNKKYRAEGFLLVEDYNKVEQYGTKVLISIPYRMNPQITST